MPNCLPDWKKLLESPEPEAAVSDGERQGEVSWREWLENEEWRAREAFENKAEIVALRILGVSVPELVKGLRLCAEAVEAYEESFQARHKPEPEYKRACKRFTGANLAALEWLRGVGR